MNYKRIPRLHQEKKEPTDDTSKDVYSLLD